MKIKRIFSVTAALLLLSLLLCSCTYNGAAFKLKNGSTVPRLAEDRIESIRVWRQGNENDRDLTEEEISTFTSLFNAATVQLVCGASTPVFGAQAVLKDGTRFRLGDEGSGRLEIQFNEEIVGSTYINILSDELWQFLKDCAEADA